MESCSCNPCVILVRGLYKVEVVLFIWMGVVTVVTPASKLRTT